MYAPLGRDDLIEPHGRNFGLWNLNKNTQTFLSKNAFDNIYIQNVDIVFVQQYVKWNIDVDIFTSENIQSCRQFYSDCNVLN